MFSGIKKGGTLPQRTAYVASLIGDDEMFFFASPGETGQDYNYNENSVLVQAIRAGYHGAFWDILRRLVHHNTSLPTIR
ncbi:hypothetical protein H8E77_21295 [bacterium]|nr:hypothetical protein [bacterium]